MYQPSHFAQTDAAALQALMQAHPLAMLVTLGPEGLTADAVPLTLDAGAGPHGTLRGHVARANPLWRHADGQAVLVVFHGPQAYVTPNWYPGKAEHHRVVPTWNYTVVQARGTLRAVPDAPWLHALVSQLTDEHEGRRPQPWSVDDAPADYLQQMLRAIVGIEVPIDTLVGKWKLSQNRPEADRAAVATGLEAEGSPQAAAVAALVRQGPR